MAWARIDNGVVAEITNRDPAGLYHPAIQWVQFDDNLGLSIGWTYDGLNFAAPVPPTLPPQTSIPSLDFLNRLTPAEQTNVAQVAQTDSDVFLFLIKTLARNTVDLTDPDLEADLDKLVIANCLTQAREIEILTP